MAENDPSFFARIFMALSVFFRLLFDAAFAGRVARLSSPVVEKAPEPKPAPKSEPPKLHRVPTDSALQLLGLLQREGRLIDFLEEDVSSYTDQDIGAAARVVHDQCKKALESHVVLERVRTETEGSRVTIPAGFSAQEIRLVGNVVGQPPFSGTLSHAGWRVKSIELPQLAEGHEVRVLSPAEIEL